MKRLARALWLLALCGLLFGCVASQPKPHAQATQKPVASKPALPGPRMHHYVFAHRVLPMLFFKHTDSIMMRLEADPQGEIKRIWEISGRSLKAMAPEGLAIESQKRPDKIRMIIVTMPPAKATVEAIYIAMIVQEKKRLYLTYERTLDFAKPEREIAVFCAWTADGSHQNFGIKGSYSRTDFEKILEDFLAKNFAPVAITKPASSE